MPVLNTEEEKRLLDHLLRIHGKPEKGYGQGMAFYRRVAIAFNATTKGSRRTAMQIRNYAGNKVRKERNMKIAEARRKKVAKRLNRPLPPVNDPLPSDLPSSSMDNRPSLLSIQSSADIVCKNVRSLGSPDKKPKSSTTSSSSSSGYMGSSSEHTEEYRSLADDLPKAWEFTELGTSYLSSTGPSSPNLTSDREEPHIFDDIDNFSIGHTSNIDKSGMSSDLVNILSEQARQHHKLKMKLLKEKFRKLSEVHKTKMFMLEKEHEMKRKEHERKMEILMQKYRSVKDRVEE